VQHQIDYRLHDQGGQGNSDGRANIRQHSGQRLIEIGISKESAPLA
jgi:hypothetical protein